jgi:putative nucleotidyltransferase with HDIG domain
MATDQHAMTVSRGLPRGGPARPFWRTRAAGFWPRFGLASQTFYLDAVAAAGLLVIAVSIWRAAVTPPGVQFYILAGLTILSGAATLRMPHVPVSFSISDSFTITAALLFGPGAGALTVALDSLVMSLRLPRRTQSVRRVLFNAAAPALAMWIAADVFFRLAGVDPLTVHGRGMVRFIGPLAIFGFLYFVLNTGLVAAAVALDQHIPLVATWRRHFLGLWLTYFGGAAVSALLVVVVYSRGPSLTMLLGLVSPIPLILYVTFKTGLGRIQDQIGHLQEVNRMHMATIDALAHAIDAKDQVTHGHIRRVQQYAVRLAQALGVTDEAQLRAIEAASLLHDLGKLAVPEHILNKPGRLTPTEFDKMKCHATVGADILAAIDFPYPVVPIVRHHHEHWNGTGYPDGLRGEAIPLGARILSVVDCFDALTSDRPYRMKLSAADALDILRERTGTMYDPAVVAGFIAIHDKLPLAAERTSGAQAFEAITLVRQGEAGPLACGTELLDPAVLVAFYDLGNEMAAAGHSADAVERIHRLLKQVMPAACTAVFRYNPGGDTLVARWVAGQHSAAIRGLTIPVGQRLTGWVAANRVTIVNSDAALDLGNLTMTPPPYACLSAAILDGHGLAGVLTVYSTAAIRFTEAQVAIIEALAPRLAEMVRHTSDAPESDAPSPQQNFQEMRSAAGDSTTRPVCHV